MIAGGIALQNIPEGMVIIGPMLAAGVSAKKTFICATLTGRNGDDLVHFAEGVGLPCEFFFVERYVFRHNRYLLLLICLS